MTRKKALIIAIKMLQKFAEDHNTQDNTQDIKDVIYKLKELLSELPACSWTKESIIDAIITYADEHNNILPRENDLRVANKLPSITVIEKRFGTLSISTFYHKYFSNLCEEYQNKSPYRFNDKEYYLEIFKRNYDRIKKEENIKYVSAGLYNRKKEPNTPIICTIKKKCGCTQYNDLLIMCGYKIDVNDLQVSINVTFSDQIIDDKANNK